MGTGSSKNKDLIADCTVPQCRNRYNNQKYMDPFGSIRIHRTVSNSLNNILHRSEDEGGKKKAETHVDVNEPNVWHAFVAH